ncbi:hypothetical protein, partial [Nocardia cyriacigeorgica]|uniref:hypothetical protein n=1 Tax=Nocardia cyriacigeorgica TaxID=135487 RepID=UPI001BB21328
MNAVTADLPAFGVLRPHNRDISADPVGVCHGICCAAATVWRTFIPYRDEQKSRSGEAVQEPVPDLQDLAVAGAS